MPTGIELIAQERDCTTYILFDSEACGYISKFGYGRIATSTTDRKVYKSLKPAIRAASLFNVGRTIPKGYPGPDKYYQDRPLVKVIEINGDIVKREHDALPEYFDLDTNTGTLTRVI